MPLVTTRITITALAALAACAAPASAQEFNLRRVAITAGGGTAEGNGYRLTVSVGQPAAGYAVGGSREVTLGVFPPPTLIPCPADFASPFGSLDINDILTFASAYNAQQPLADLFPEGGDNVFDINDVLIFAAAFNTGCP